MPLTQPLHVLVVEDEPSMRAVCEGFVRSFGHQVECVEHAENALSKLKDAPFDLVLADYKLPGMDGLHLLQHIKEEYPATEVIIMTAYADISSAVQAIRYDAFDYLPKPFELEEMQRALRKLERIKNLTFENEMLRKQLKKEYSIHRIVGSHPDIEKVREIVARICQENFTVLIEGENGTGKELAAKVIHYNSPRASNPFVPIECSTIAPEHLEKELFGHERPAGSAAAPGPPHPGLFKLAEGGTVFLDEVGQLPLEMQAKLLRYLQERTIRPVGGVSEAKVDVRIIAATTENLEESVRKDQFRQDLMYLLNVVNLRLPPLRERKDDIRLLIDHFIRMRSTGSRRIRGISRDAVNAVLNYQWPGNVRELENMVERALALGLTERIEKEDLPPAVLRAAENPAAHLIATDADLKSLDEMEKEVILRTLQRTGGDKMLAAQVLKIDRSTLYRKLKRF
ncbi:MAG: sigma-54-dependent Fis family transcriptional regulator [Planctomycetes bacterium]|nr:sigma-54-dependent Fis family transcriptional regulator [Planctomycetota bacterium]